MRKQDVVSVQQYTKSTGGIGQAVYTASGEPVTVPCNVYPLTAEEVTTYGLQEIETRSVVCDLLPGWPGRPHSRITFEGAEWDQYAMPKTYNKTRAATSVQIIIKKRG